MWPKTTYSYAYNTTYLYKMFFSKKADLVFPLIEVVNLCTPQVILSRKHDYRAYSGNFGTIDTLTLLSSCYKVPMIVQRCRVRDGCPSFCSTGGANWPTWSDSGYEG